MRLILKFGGTSVADIGRMRHVATIVAREIQAGHEVAVVVSAMAGKRPAPSMTQGNMTLWFPRGSRSPPD